MKNISLLDLLKHESLLDSHEMMFSNFGDIPSNSHHVFGNEVNNTYQPYQPVSPNFGQLDNYQSSYSPFQPSPINRLRQSSSSTDSFSPENYPDRSTDFRRKRPIRGRRIFENNQNELGISPTSVSSFSFGTSPENCRNYELFPSYPTEFNSVPPPMNQYNNQFGHQFNQPSTAMSNAICMFCRKNGETASVYTQHILKERVGNKFVVRCPILRRLVCSYCKATGDNAHTESYCPILRNKNNGMPIQSTTVILKNTRVKSNGRKRF